MLIDEKFLENIETAIEGAAVSEFKYSNHKYKIKK